MNFKIKSYELMVENINKTLQNKIKPHNSRQSGTTVTMIDQYISLILKDYLEHCLNLSTIKIQPIYEFQNKWLQSRIRHQQTRI